MVTTATSCPGLKEQRMAKKAAMVASLKVCKGLVQIFMSL
jgi:hypothetical protein